MVNDSKIQEKWARFRDGLAPAVGPLVFAHRGLHEEEVENTVEAFRAAWALGLPIECDIQMTLDHKFVVHHDENTARTTGHNCLIRETTAEVLTSLRDASGKLCVALLETVLDLNPELPIVLELKAGKDDDLKAYARGIANLLQDFPKLDAVLIAFHPGLIRALRALELDLPTGYLTAAKYEKSLTFSQKLFLQSKAALRFSRAQSVFYDPGAASWGWIRKTWPKGMWTLDEEHEWAEAAQEQVSIIMSNTPVEARQWFETQEGRNKYE